MNRKTVIAFTTVLLFLAPFSLYGQTAGLNTGYYSNMGKSFIRAGVEIPVMDFSRLRFAPSYERIFINESFYGHETKYTVVNLDMLYNIVQSRKIGSLYAGIGIGFHRIKTPYSSDSFSTVTNKRINFITGFRLNRLSKRIKPYGQIRYVSGYGHDAVFSLGFTIGLRH